MKKSIMASVSLGMMLFGMATAAQAGTVTYPQDIYQAGSNPEGSALDNTGFFYGDGGTSTISWTFVVEQSGYAILSITAEGIDSAKDDSLPLGEDDLVTLGEDDSVTMQYGTSTVDLGYLTQQGFYSGSSKLYPGPGALADITEITTSVFDLGFLEAGTYTFTVSVELGLNGEAWVNEIETSSLTVTTVPTQTSMLLLGTGLVGLAAVGRKKQY